jgi:UDP-N-acetylmuramate dehydrogenase
MIIATDEREVAEVALGDPNAGLVVLAGGSNVVIADAGIPGTVLLIRSAGLEATADGSSVLLTAQAGHPWDEVDAFAVAEGLAGIECLSGIPGSAGATPIQNVGAYGQEVAETIVEVRVADRTTGSVRVMSAAECQFAYRTSRFKHNDRFVVLAVTFRLNRDTRSAPVRFGELSRLLGTDRPTLAQTRQAVLTLRAGKGMVLDPTDPDTYSVGSFFTNPVLDPAAFELVRSRSGGAEPAAWPQSDGTVKVSAAWLIEHAGFHRGYQGAQPGVALSSKHTLALTNRGTGTTAALLDLAREIRDGVRKAYEVELHPEPVLINCAL